MQFRARRLVYIQIGRSDLSMPNEYARNACEALLSGADNSTDAAHGCSNALQGSLSHSCRSVALSAISPPSVSSQTRVCPASRSHHYARGIATARIPRGCLRVAYPSQYISGSPRRRPSTDIAWRRAAQSSRCPTAASATVPPGIVPQCCVAASMSCGRAARRRAGTRQRVSYSW